MSAPTTPAKVAPTAKPVAKPQAPKGVATPPPAKKAPAPVAKAPVFVPTIEPSIKNSVVLDPSKSAHSFRLYSRELAAKLGYEEVASPGSEQLVTFVKGDVRIEVTYSVQDYVRRINLNGTDVVIPNDAAKWKKLNALLLDPTVDLKTVK